MDENLLKLAERSGRRLGLIRFVRDEIEYVSEGIDKGSDAVILSHVYLRNVIRALGVEIDLDEREYLESIDGRVERAS